MKQLCAWAKSCTFSKVWTQRNMKQLCAWAKQSIFSNIDQSKCERYVGNTWHILQYPFILYTIAWTLMIQWCLPVTVGW